MNTQQFLELVWPASGVYLLAVPAQFTAGDGTAVKYFRHYAATSIADAATQANQLAAGHGEDANGVDVFFALATVKEDLTTLSKKQCDALGKKVRGVHKTSRHDNTDQIKAFWLDIDVKADPAAYPTQQEAFDALGNFVAATGLPDPYVVSSGGGLHVYWPLTSPLPVDQWVHYAAILKQLTKSHGLRADPSRTSDRASVLRPVGTYNWKTGAARAVQVVHTGVVSDPKHVTSKLAYLAETAKLPAGKPPSPAVNITGAASVNNVIASSMVNSGPPADAKLTVKRCRQLTWQATTPTAVSEPQWYDMVGCLRHAENGAAAVHIMSRGHPNYSAADTDAKITQHEQGGYGPTLCQTFEDHRPGGCAGCPYQGKVKTPLHLGREEKVAPAPVITVATAYGQSQLALPDAPFPFKRATDATTGETKLMMRTFDDDDNELGGEVIYEYDLYPSGLVYHEREAAYYCAVRRFLPKDGWADFEFQIGKLYDRRSLANMLGNIGVVPDLGKIEYVVQYMIAYIRDLQKQAAATVVHAQLGWREDKRAFVLPEQLVTPIGSEPLRISRNVTDTLSWRAPRGDLETWKSVVALFERPDMAGHQFGFGVGFAAPLFKFTNFRGMIVSMVGARGSGKSSAALCANSVWGHPTMGWTDMEHDTRKAFYEKLGVLQHLPVTYDEITNLDPDLLSDLCYAVSKGQGRRRLNTDGTAQSNFGSWQTMMLTTSNSSLHARLQLSKADASAESVRVFEYSVPANTLQKYEADTAFNLLNDHYGLAATPYVQFLVTNADKTALRVKHWIATIDSAANVTSGERFWSAGPACVMTAFEITNHLGLTNVDMKRMFDFILTAIIKMRGVVDDGVRTPNSILADYLNSNLRNTLVISSKPERHKITMVAREPSGELRIRYDLWDDRLYIDRQHFRQFCADRRIEYGATRDQLIKSGVLLNDKLRLTLGKGTNYGTAQCWVLSLTTAHADMAGTKPTLVSGVAPVLDSAATP